jgi:hypothetical protein
MTELKIQMDDTGKINVSGPLHDQILCFGLLEIAKQVVIDNGKLAQLQKINNIVKPDLKLVKGS